MSSPLTAGTAMDVDASMSGESITDIRCPHIETAFAVEAARLSMLRKYKSAVAWGASGGGRAAKRRKVKRVSTILFDPQLNVYLSSAPNSDMWDMWTRSA